MKRGLVIGKFMPLHNGHIALIRFAAAQCKELIVSMSYTAADPIDARLRFGWITGTFKDQSHIRPEIVQDDFDDENLPMAERTKIWAVFIKSKFPGVDIIFSSEDYGDLLGKALGIPHQSFDISRNQFPVSATMIRNRPLRYWDFIAEIARPYFVKKVCFYGPESTGKSTMAKHFADLYLTEFVPEVAREMITSNDFTVEDIVRIGRAQTQRVLEKIKIANKVLFCDTDLITTQIYSSYYLHEVPAILLELEKLVTYDHYFLFDVDVPWVGDGLRDLSGSRKEMYGIFERELVRRSIAFDKVSGSWIDRERRIQERLGELG